MVSNCNSSKTCRLCHHKHHQSICNRQEDNPQNNRGQPSQSMVAQDGANVQEKTTHQNTAITGQTVTAQAKTKGTVLLQTARAIATNSSNCMSTPVRILFDSGSQRTYVTEEVR